MSNRTGKEAAAPGRAMVPASPAVMMPLRGAWLPRLAAVVALVATTVLIEAADDAPEDPDSGAEQAAAATPPPPPPAVDEQVAARIGETDGARWLEAPSGRFLLIDRPPSRPGLKGVVLLVPGYDRHADWPAVIAPLARSLPEHGWRSLVVDMSVPVPETEAPAVADAAPDPDPADAPPAASTAADPADADPEAAAVAEPLPDPAAVAAAKRAAFEATALERLGLSLADAKAAKPAVLTVVAVADAAPWVLKALAADRSGVDALVMVSPRLPADTEATLTETLAGLRLPVLAVEGEAEPPSERRHAEARFRDARSAGVDFERRRVEATDQRYRGAEAELDGVVRGWCERLRRILVAAR